MTKKLISVGSAVASAIAGVALSGAAAQPADQATAQAPALEEIVVTARRREEKLQSVPISVTAFTGAALDQQHVENATDLQRLVPSLTLYSIQRDQQFFQIRGQYTANGGPGVVTYFNEVPLLAPIGAGGFPAGPGGGPGQYYDLDSSQILKGPQGTLFGQNTTGGAILLYPKKPGNDFSGYGQVTFGNYNDQELEAAANIPIIPDELLVRVSGRRATRDGFTTDLQTGKDLDNRDYWAGRLSVLWRPTDDFENYLVANSIYDHTNGTSFILDAVKPAAKGGIVAAVWDAILGKNYVENLLLRQQAAGPRVVIGEFGEGLGRFFEGVGPLQKIWNWSITDVATWNVADDVTLKNIFGYQSYKQRAVQGPAPVPTIDFIQPNGWNTNEEEISDEFQAQGKGRDGKLNWQVGAFASFIHPAGAESFIIQTLTNPAVTSQHPVSLSRALYTQESYDLGDIYAPLDGLKFTAGYRYTWDYRSQTATQVLPLAHRCQLAIAIYPACSQGGNVRFQSPNWTIGLDYQITPETLLYIVGRRGYIAGGINTTPAVPGTASFKPQYLDDVEIGVKSDWEIWGMKARTDLDGYIGYFKSIQTSASIVIPGTVTTVNITENNGKATISGVEFEGALVPLPGLELSATYAYIDAHFNQYVSIGFCCTLDPTFPDTPQNKISLTGTYHLPFIPEQLGDVSASATWSYQSHVAIAVSGDHTLGILEPGYGLLNLRLDWTNVAKTNLDASFFMTNALDQLYRVGDFALYSQLGFYSDVYGEPRMWGFQIRYHW